MCECTCVFLVVKKVKVGLNQGRKKDSSPHKGKFYFLILPFISLSIQFSFSLTVFLRN